MTKQLFFTAVAILVLFVGEDSKSFAEVIARFDFEGNNYTAEPIFNGTGSNTGLNLSNSAAAAGVSIGILQFSPGLDPTAALGFAASDYDNALGFSTDANSNRNLLTSNQSIFFNVNVQSGFKLDLDSLSFDSLKTRGANTRDSRVTYSIFVNPAGDPSTNGLIGDFDFVTNLAHDHYALGESGAESTGGSFSTGRWSAGPVDLSGKKNLAGTNTIAIRMYGSDGIDQDFGIDNLVLNGQVAAIPEPSSAGILLLITAGICYRRRRSSAPDAN